MCPALCWGDSAEFDAEARDHVLATCPVALKEVEMFIAKCSILMALSFPPYEQDVEVRLEYLGKLSKAWQSFFAHRKDLDLVVED